MRRNKLPPFQPLQGTREDPDEGSGSEDDEEDKEWEDNDLDYESDGEEEKDSVSSASVEKSHANKYEEDLVKGYKANNTNLVHFILTLYDYG